MLEKVFPPYARPYVVFQDVSLHDALSAMDLNGLGGVIVSDSANKAVGTLTDGDIRRAILSGKTLSGPISGVGGSDFFSVLESDPPAKAYSIAKKELVSFIPILDENTSIVGAYIRSNGVVEDKFDTPVLIMAGGRGSRMGKLTRARPKPLLEVNGLPLIDAVMGTAIGSGFRRFFVSINYMGHQIETHLRDSIQEGVSVDFIREDSPMGTAGAIGMIRGEFERTLLVMNADIIHNVDLADFLLCHEKEGSDLSIVAMEYHHQVPFGVLKIANNRITEIDEKPKISQWVSAGIYAISHSVFESFQFGGYCDMTDVAEHLVHNSKSVSPYYFEGYWRDLGNPEALDEVSRSFQQDSHEQSIENASPAFECP